MSRTVAKRWDPDSDSLPTYKELPEVQGHPKGAAWIWGPDDHIGRINLLTPRRVKKASELIQVGEIIPINLPLDVPKVPSWGRKPFGHTIISLVEGIIYDDLYDLNTQSGTQWDGFRHAGHRPSKLFYNGTTAEDIRGPSANNKASIQHIAQHGIAGRGILLDYWTYVTQKGLKCNPFERFEVSLESLNECAQSEGLDLRPKAQGGDVLPGDILLIRFGWAARYNESTPEQREQAARRAEPEWIGLSPEGGTVEWLHDCYFAAVGGDAPAFEAWPPKAALSLHENLLALWGVPIGEMIDLEQLSKRCRELQRWTFFMTSQPANCTRGVSTHVNGMAIL